MDNGAPVAVPDGSAKLDSMLSKLALKKITVTGMNGGASASLPSYKFAYYDTTLSWKDVACNVSPLLEHYQDDFGFFWHDPADPDASTYDDRDGRMWSLKEIIYPEGGRLLIEYENDWLLSLTQSYSKFTYPATYQGNLTAQFKRYRQGGARVTFITNYDGYSSNGDAVAFSYAAGYHSGIPETWFLKWGAVGEPLSFSGERGQFNVTYNLVQKTFDDGSSVKTFYKTGNGAEQQMLYIRGGVQAAILQGNTRWNWGEIDRIEYHAPGAGNTKVKEELFYTKFLGVVYNEDTVAVVAPSLPYSGGSTPPIYLNFTHKQIDSVVTKHYFGSNVVTSRESYDYNDGTLLQKKTEASADGKVRTTENTYIHDVLDLAVADSMKNRNMRTQIAQTSIKQNNDNTKGYSSTVTTWKIVTHNGKNKFLPDQEYRWRNSSTSATIPSFNWTSPPGNSNWILTQTFDQYDQHGNLKRIIGAYGGADSTTIRWDATGTLIDSMKTRPNATTTLTTKYGYDLNTFRLTSITDPNNQKTEFKYDPLQRLIETINPDKRTAATQSYLYSRQAAGSSDNFATTNPNHVRTVASTHAEHLRNNDFETGSTSPDFWVMTKNGSGTVGTWETTGYVGRSVSAQKNGDRIK
jgi:YD repeat-containing protein